MGESYLFVPSIRRGNGTGHLRRALSLMRRMSDEGGRELRLYLLLPAKERRREIHDLLQLYRLRDTQIIDETMLESLRTDFLIVDRRATTSEEFRLYRRAGLPVGLDEGGGPRSFFPLLIDTFPLPAEFGPANIADPGLLDLPERGGSYPRSFERIMLSFGGEDPAGLTESSLEALQLILCASLPAGKSRAEGPPLSRAGEGGPLAGLRRVTVIEGPLFERRIEFPAGLEAFCGGGERKSGPPVSS